MLIVLLKSVKLALKGSKTKKLVPANGEEIEVSEATGKELIEKGLAIDPSQKVIKVDEKDKIIKSLKEEIETLKEDITTKDEEIETLKAKDK